MRARGGNKSGHSGLATAQGIYCLLTGVWPILHLPSFEAVSGPKVDGWLVKTVGALTTVFGGVLLSAARRRRITPEVAALGAGSALAFATIDVVYVARRRISPVYLADAVVQALILLGWVARSRPRSAPPAVSDQIPPAPIA